MTEAQQRLATNSLKQAYYSLINIPRKGAIDWEIINLIELAISKLQTGYIEDSIDLEKEKINP